MVLPGTQSPFFANTFVRFGPRVSSAQIRISLAACAGTIVTPAANDIVAARARPLSSLFFTKLISFRIRKPLLGGAGFLVAPSHPL
jgi:ABC-type Co2+ transport system permease subunit